MKYFDLINETDIDKIGNVDGIQGFLSDDVQAKKLQNKSLYSKISISKITSILLDEKVILTDFMKVGSLSLEGFLISKRLKKIIEKYKLKDVQFIPVSFLNKSNIKDYSFMFFNSDLSSKIDYQKTPFGLYKRSLLSGKSVYTPVEVEKNNRKDLIALNKQYAGSVKYSIITEKGTYYFKNTFNYDVFRIGYFDKRFYFSEQLKKELEAANLTGFYFSDTPLIIHSPAR